MGPGWGARVVPINAVYYRLFFEKTHRVNSMGRSICLVYRTVVAVS